MKQALLIGINYFNTSNRLQGCHKDVIRMKTFLLAHGFTYFTVLLDSESDPNFQSAFSPTREKILYHLKNMLSQLQDGDEMFIHYSGHGSYVSDKNGDEKDRKDEAICPVDGPFITDDELNECLMGCGSPHAKVYCLMDCCHSGSVFDLPWRFDKQGKYFRENAKPISKQVLAISGCRDNQVSMDAFIDNSFSGALTWAFLSAAQDLSSSDQWTWRDMLVLLRYKLVVGKYVQEPQMTMTNKAQLDELVPFIHTTAQTSNVYDTLSHL